MIDEWEAREIAAAWIDSRSPELCRFATGHDIRNPDSAVDWEEFLAEIEACRPYADANVAAGNEMAATSHQELDHLFAYARMRLGDRKTWQHYFDEYLPRFQAEEGN